RHTRLQGDWSSDVCSSDLAAEIVTRGFASESIAADISSQGRDVMSKTLRESSTEEMRDYGVVKEKIRQDLKRFIVKSTSRRPMRSEERRVGKECRTSCRTD